MDRDLLALMACPDCRAGLSNGSERLECIACGCSFPVVDGTPILLGSGSVFTKAQVASASGTYYATKARENRLKQRLRKALPRLTKSIGSEDVHAIVAEALRDHPGPLVALELGAGERPGSAARLFPQARWITTDVDRSYGAMIVADALSIPLNDESMDLVIASQVLEHVYDIARAAREIQRVLRPGGIVVVGMPFLYPWHGVPFDFFRCTPSGLRALFDKTRVLYIGHDSGPWSAVALLLEGRVVELFRRRFLRMGAVLVARLLLWPLRYLEAVVRPDDLSGSASLHFVGVRLERGLRADEVMEELRSRFGTPL